MPTFLRRCVLLLAMSLVLPAAEAADLQVVLVRHAEKGSDDARDPSLSPIGQARAAALATAVAGLRIDAVYATQFRRTQQTALPTATAAGVDVTVRAANGDPADAAAFAAHLRQQHAGQTVLVVGHSNTVPAIANALLGHDGVGPIEEHEFEHLWLVNVPADGAARLLHAQQPALPAP